MNTLTVLNREILTQVMTFLAVTQLTRPLAHPLRSPFLSCHLQLLPLVLVTCGWKLICSSLPSTHVASPIFILFCLKLTLTERDFVLITCQGIGCQGFMPEGGQGKSQTRDTGKALPGARG